MIERLDHINLRTARLDAMIEWYGRVLDMHPGPRPDFAFAGAWLYANGLPLVHLVGVAREPGADARDLKLEHGAFRATGFAAFMARLEGLGERSEVVKVPGFPIVQVNVWDPDRNHLHIDYDAAEAPDVG
jgi:catechol 2,3-dioxygenase-like lactoylglutathione lyase family enzyme